MTAAPTAAASVTAIPAAAASVTTAAPATAAPMTDAPVAAAPVDAVPVAVSLYKFFTLHFYKVCNLYFDILIFEFDIITFL